MNIIHTFARMCFITTYNFLFTGLLLPNAFVKSHSSKSLIMFF